MGRRALPVVRSCARSRKRRPSPRIDYATRRCHASARRPSSSENSLRPPPGAVRKRGRRGAAAGHRCCAGGPGSRGARSGRGDGHPARGTQFRRARGGRQHRRRDAARRAAGDQSFGNARAGSGQDLQISARGFGSRAAFGVRGVRLYQDFIPATMPDGQGQTGSFSLLSAQRVEVLRGPFSTLYGNASGGVIAVFTEDPPATPVVDATLSAGSFATINAGLKATGTAGGVGYVVAANHFDTDGYRAHAAATRDIANAKLVFAAGDATRITVIGSSLHQPDAQDPLGLTQAQWEADPRQADPVTEVFDTRKTVNQLQGGVAVEYAFAPALALRVTGYGGRRQIGQFLAFSGAALASSGGVVNLDRDYGGAGARIIYRGTFAGAPLTLSAGVNADRMREQRQGFVNDGGKQGALRRDEIDTVGSADAYAEAQWHALPWLSLTLGVRTSRVRYEATDRYITPQNPDDSGARTYRNTSPVAAVLWHLRDDVNLYASYGQGFETPTFAELAYRPAGPGLNLDLQPALAAAVEVGVKWLPTRGQRVNVAAFTARTRQEIVVDTATGGRTTFRNASDTRRRGFEAEWDADLGSGMTVHVNYTWLDATFADAFVAGTPPTVVPAGARLPGVPPQQAFATLRWTPAGAYGFSANAEVQYVGRVYANDRNTVWAPAYTVGNVWLGFARASGAVRLAAYVRVNNIANVGYVGSVIVGDTNGRYFESAPGRNWMAGTSFTLSF
ncbi:MAG: TonB-dependent receptor [Betaproteobacteria bacterium]